jgi:thymidylate kinase
MAFSAESSDQMRKAADDPHGQTPRGLPASVLKLGWLWVNWWIGWLMQLRAKSAVGVILFDRYHADLLVDPKRYRYGGPSWLAKLASRCMPQPYLVLFLDAPPEVLLSRKQEVSEASLAKARAAYLRLTESHPRFRVIDASKPLEVVVTEVVAAIRKLR